MIIMCDLIFNRSEHRKLLWTCQRCLAPAGIALVSFSHHDPLKRDQDLVFFDLAREYGFGAERALQRQMVDVFQENDGLDAERGIVYVYYLRFSAHPAVGLDGTPQSSSVLPPTGSTTS
jgi:nicotinamide N-methyltransferase